MAFTRKSAEEKQLEIDNLTKDMDNSIETFFDSPKKIMSHLKAMANFHNYSIRNTMAIENQFLGAQAVGSFNFWKSKGATINKGEKGIKILVPTPIEYFRSGTNDKGEPIWKQKKYANANEKAKIDKNQMQMKKVMYFKIGHVFEYTQTNAREKGIEISDIFNRYHRNGSVDNENEFNVALGDLAASLNVKISETPLQELGVAKGAFYPDLNVITLNPRNTNNENITTLIHELAHAKLHNKEKMKERDLNLSTGDKEYQAEMTAYVVSEYFGVASKEFSVSYLSGWNKDRTLQSNEILLNEVRSTAKDFIEIIENSLETQMKVNNLVSESENSKEILDAKARIILDENTIDLINPKIILHDRFTDPKNFGEINNLPFNDKKENIPYTIILKDPETKKEILISDSFNTERFLNPLHQIEIEKKIPQSQILLLEKDFHDYLGELEKKEINDFLSDNRTKILEELKSEPNHQLRITSNNDLIRSEEELYLLHFHNAVTNEIHTISAFNFDLDDLKDSNDWKENKDELIFLSSVPEGINSFENISEKDLEDILNEGLISVTSDDLITGKSLDDLATNIFNFHENGKAFEMIVDTKDLKTSLEIIINDEKTVDTVTKFKNGEIEISDLTDLGKTLEFNNQTNPKYDLSYLQKPFQKVINDRKLDNIERKSIEKMSETLNLKLIDNKNKKQIKDNDLVL